MPSSCGHAERTKLPSCRALVVTSAPCHAQSKLHWSGTCRFTCHPGTHVQIGLPFFKHIPSTCSWRRNCLLVGWLVTWSTKGEEKAVSMISKLTFFEFFFWEKSTTPRVSFRRSKTKVFYKILRILCTSSIWIINIFQYECNNTNFVSELSKQ